MYLTFPTTAADLLAPHDRQTQSHASVILSSAIRTLGNRPVISMDGCVTYASCAPVRPGKPVCPLCAVDAAVERLANGFDEGTATYIRNTGTLAKQALVYVMEANPDASAEEAAADLSMRLHRRDLTARTAAQQQEAAARLMCLRAIERTALGGRLLMSVTDDMRAQLEARGWALNGYITPQGKFAREEHARQVAAWRKANAS